MTLLLHIYAFWMKIMEGKLQKKERKMNIFFLFIQAKFLLTHNEKICWTKRIFVYSKNVFWGVYTLSIPKVKSKIREKRTKQITNTTFNSSQNMSLVILHLVLNILGFTLYKTLAEGLFWNIIHTTD